jgi:hypothetical protein
VRISRRSAETALYLGLIHHADVAGDRAHIAAAHKVLPRFGVATECGWAAPIRRTCRDCWPRIGM